MTDKSLRGYLLDALASVVSKRGAAYVAGPLATGKEYYALIASGRGEDARRIRQVNDEALRNFVFMLRNKLSHPVIDPSILIVSEWTSKEIGDFFIDVIGLYAKEMWLMDGWEYSRGATKEFVYCIKNGVACFDACGNAVNGEHGLSLIDSACSYLDALGIDSSPFAGRASDLRVFLGSQYPK